MNAKAALVFLALAALLSGCLQQPAPQEPAPQAPSLPGAGGEAPAGGQELGGQPAGGGGAGGGGSEVVLEEAVQPPPELAGVDELESELADLNDLDDFLQEDVLAGDEVASTELQ